MVCHRRQEKALETLRGLARPFPPAWKFDREEANERDRTLFRPGSTLTRRHLKAES